MSAFFPKAQFSKCLVLIHAQPRVHGLQLVLAITAKYGILLTACGVLRLFSPASFTTVVFSSRENLSQYSTAPRAFKVAIVAAVKPVTPVMFIPS